MTPATTHHQLIDTFLASTAVSASTRATYGAALRHFAASLTDGTPPTPRAIGAWRDKLVQDGMSALSANTYLSCVRVFFAWAHGEGLAVNAAQGVRGLRVRKAFRRDALTAELATKVMDAATDTRARLIVELEMRQGLRGIEVHRANVGDVTTRDGHDVMYVQGKGRGDKDEFIILCPATMVALNAYLAERGPVRHTDPLIVSGRGPKAHTRMSTRSIRSVVTAALITAKVKAPRVTAHSCRHTTADLLRRAGVPITDIQRVLRHRSVDTTMIYTAMAEDAARLAAPTEYQLNTMF
jgi:integrase/recombinase XerD